MNNRIKYIDGMRGLASLVVLFSHLILGFFPILHTINPNDLANQATLITILATTPLNIFYHGSFAVIMFFIISGYIISYKYFKKADHNYITSGTFRRYFRLTIPALFSCLIAYFLLKFDLFFNEVLCRIPRGLPRG